MTSLRFISCIIISDSWLCLHSLFSCAFLASWLSFVFLNATLDSWFKNMTLTVSTISRRWGSNSVLWMPITSTDHKILKLWTTWKLSLLLDSKLIFSFYFAHLPRPQPNLSTRLWMGFPAISMGWFGCLLKIHKKGVNGRIGLQTVLTF